ncbi:hypothetical protein [Rhizobium sp. G21]|uniref:hypothetical protein n=1 Tax=Rhizobium sp. G21 TaxID=2758439 RepID=UPI001600FD1C|nr:hypothetical protein [Rhizobium sp. G21]MBB1249625.1 hypothetical protein [Rhizobium sp. G21]
MSGASRPVVVAAGAGRTAQDLEHRILDIGPSAVCGFIRPGSAIGRQHVDIGDGSPGFVVVRLHGLPHRFARRRVAGIELHLYEK